MTRHLDLPRDEYGAVQVEFAFSILLVLVLVFLMIEFCSAVYTYVVLSDAANEGVRYAIVNSQDSSFTTNTQNKVKTYAAYSLHDVSGMTITLTCPDSSGGCPGTPALPGRVQLSVSYPYIPYLSLVMSSPPTMHAYAEGRFVY